MTVLILAAWLLIVFYGCIILYIAGTPAKRQALTQIETPAHLNHIIHRTKTELNKYLFNGKQNDIETSFGKLYNFDHLYQWLDYHLDQYTNGEGHDIGFIEVPDENAEYLEELLRDDDNVIEFRVD